MKTVITREKARDLIENVVNNVCDIIGSTLGPNGRNVIIDSDFLDSFITNDGVTIAKELELTDEEEVVAKIIKQASIKTNDSVGDGTTTTLVLLKAIYNQGIKLINNGISPFEIKKNLETTLKIVINEIQKMSTKVTLKDIDSVASTSSNDKEIGNIIQKCLNKIGSNGLILLEENTSNKIKLKIINGLSVNIEVSSVHFLDNRKNKILNDPLILVTDYRINYINEIENILSLVNAESKDLIIIASDYEEDVINELLLRKNVICLKTPEYSYKRYDVLEDISVYTGAKLINSNKKDNLYEININDFGKCSKVLIDNEKIIIYNGNGNQDEIKNRRKFLKKELLEEKDLFYKEILESRLANMCNGIATIFVGADTKVELIEKKMRIEDAICASKSALTNGVVYGGGLTYFRVAKKLNDYEECIGIKIFKTVLEEPLKKIISNNLLSYEKIIDKLKHEKESVGYDALNNKITDMIESKIFDSTNVIIESLKNAVSVAGLLLTTDTIIVNKNKKDKINLETTEVL